MRQYNEYSNLLQVAIRSAENAFISEEKLAQEWQPLRFHAKPQFDQAISEYADFRRLLSASGANIVELRRADHLTIDSLYTRDSVLVSPKGLILCNMGRTSRTPEASENAAQYEALGHKIAGRITAPGTLEGGDFIWLDENHAAVGLGPRTNRQGVRQLKAILGDTVQLHEVELPQPEHPDDVLHLMSIISPVDKDLALIYRPFMPDSSIAWLEKQGLTFIDVAEDEYPSMGCNVLAIAPRSVIMLQNLPAVKQALQTAGCDVTTYTGMEISRKGEGGPTCLTRPLIRA